MLRALHARLPGEDFVYLGDTARVPYGTKSAESVTRYALQASRLLVERGVKLLVVACNTASAVALPALRQAHPGLALVGVVEPGARASCEASRAGVIAVIATEGTVRGGAYQEAIRRVRPAARVVARACSLLVALAEEGWTEGALVEAIVARSLDGLFHGAPGERPDALVLGCTHFPMLAGALRAVVGPEVTLVDSAETTAAAVHEALASRGLEREGSAGRLDLLATDGPERFARVGSRFLGEPLDPRTVERVDL